jgi:hypothetical protein
MPALPVAGALLVRTDFADDGTWDQVQATAPDPLDAALRALYAAAVTFGRDRYRVLFEEVRAAFNL